MNQKLTIGFENLSIEARIGVNHEEKLKKQKLLVSAELTYPKKLKQWFEKNDMIEKAYDYTLMVSSLKDLFIKEHYDLLEHLIQKTLLLIIKLYPSCIQVKLSILKPSAIPEAEAAVTRLTWAK